MALLCTYVPISQAMQRPVQLTLLAKFQHLKCSCGALLQKVTANAHKATGAFRAGLLITALVNTR
jgi:hypothetical protein